MNKLTYKLSTGIATAALLTAALMPAAFADTTVSVTDNGAHSDNYVSVDNSSSSNVTQSNTTDVTNVVTVSQYTGGNSASYNVGGDNSVTSGDASSTVKTTVTGSTNDATLNPCGCLDSVTDVTVDGNGAKSHNKVKLNNHTTSTTKQTNKTSVTNVVSTTQKTGKNKSNNNVGGSNSVTSGMTDSTVKLKVTGGSNTLL